MKSAFATTVSAILLSAFLTGLALGQEARPHIQSFARPKKDLSVLLTPKTSGVDYTSKPAISIEKIVATLGSMIVKYGRDHLGQKIGDGQCSSFVSAALAYAGAKPGDFRDPKNYVWGTRVPAGAVILPGDIIQFEDCYFKWTSGNSWGTFDMPHHTAIIESANGTALVLLQQNAPIGSPVSRQNLDLNWKQSGTYTIWRAIK